MKAIIEYVLLCGLQTPLSDEPGTQVITYFDLVMFPENVRLKWLTPNENNGKEAADMMASLHVPGLLQTLIPLPIVLQQTASQTGCFVSGMDLTFKCFEMVPRFWTFDCGQEHSEIETFPSRGVDKVHPPDDMALTTYVPLLCLFVPSEGLGKVLIGGILCTLQSPIGGEPLCQVGLLDGIASHELLRIIIIIIKIDHLLIFFMDWQAVDRRLFLMQGKFKDVPATLRWTNKMEAYVFQYLINILSHFQSGTIMTLVYVLVNVLYGLDGSADLNIDVTVICTWRTEKDCRE